jgi:hypothetical protein
MICSIVNFASDEVDPDCPPELDRLDILSFAFPVVLPDGAYNDAGLRLSSV